MLPYGEPATAVTAVASAKASIVAIVSSGEPSKAEAAAATTEAPISTIVRGVEPSTAVAAAAYAKVSSAAIVRGGEPSKMDAAAATTEAPIAAIVRGGEPATEETAAATTEASIALILRGGEPGRALMRLLAHAHSHAAERGFTIEARLAGGASPVTTLLPARPGYFSFVLGKRKEAGVETSRAVVGTPVVLEIVASRDCYFYVIDQDSGGGLCPLVPSNDGQARVDNKLAAGAVRKLPDEAKGDTFAIDFCPPAGLETLFVFATQTPWREWDSLVASSGVAGAACVEERLARSVVGRGMARMGPASADTPADDLAVATWAHVFELFEA